MKVIIAGSRGRWDSRIVDEAVKASGFEVTTVISGGAWGIDRMGEEWAVKHDIPVILMEADWDQHGKSAGKLRNIDMANEAEALIAIWDGRSSGTKHMIDTAIWFDLEVYVHEAR